LKVVPTKDQDQTNLTMELQERLLSLQKELSTPREIAFYRIKLLEDDVNDGDGQQQQPDGGLASILVPLLKDSLSAWLTLTLAKKLHKKQGVNSALLSEMTGTMNLRLALAIHLQVTKMNPSLGEELGREGSHAPLVKLMNLDLAEFVDGDKTDHCTVDEANQDCVIELQDLACEIAALASSFPVKVAPFCAHGLRQRLPLVFFVGALLPAMQDLHSKNGTCGSGEYEKQSKNAEAETVLIHQVTTRQSAQEDVGFGT
jgi:hypothetical protein